MKSTWFVVAVSLGLTSCALSTQHGDAVLKDEPNIVFRYADPLVFPKTPLGGIATFSYRVLNLPQEIYPTGFLLDIPQTEDSRYLHNQPWRNCIIKASLITPEGKIFFSKKIDFSKDWNGYSQPGSDSEHREIHVTFTDYKFENGTSSLPKQLSYILRIEVLRPSSDPSDKLEVDAFTDLHR